MPTIEELLGDWITNETYPLHLGQNNGFTIKFHFDRLPFDNHTIARLSAIADKSENIFTGGEVKIEPSVNDEFFIIVDKVRIPARRFDGKSFLADIAFYGVVEFYKLN